MLNYPHPLRLSSPIPIPRSSSHHGTLPQTGPSIEPTQRVVSDPRHRLSRSLSLFLSRSPGSIDLLLYYRTHTLTHTPAPFVYTVYIDPTVATLNDYRIVFAPVFAPVSTRCRPPPSPHDLTITSYLMRRRSAPVRPLHT